MKQLIYKWTENFSSALLATIIGGVIVAYIQMSWFPAAEEKPAPLSPPRGLTIEFVE